ncbi:MAG: lytic murein transglycosylase, partial [Pseudomonas sp.]|nr:lytic murein transglycosylase [Pseudomonas sp.]
MRARPFVLLALLLTSLGLFQSASAASLAQQRILYDEAKRALGKNDPAPYLRNRQALQGYPLEAHLAYDELTLRLKSASNREIETFLAEHGDLPQIGWMKLRWLRWLAERGDWQTFIKHYSPALEFTELDCLLGEYQFRHGKAADGAITAQRLWLTGKSQPNTCDRLFDLWRARGGLTEDMRWQRLKLAAQERNYGLASYLQKTLGSLAGQGQLLIEMAQKPELLLQRQRFAATDRHTADAVGLGLRRLARQNPEQALGLLEEYSRHLPFSSEEKVAIAREIGLTL